MCVRTSGAPSAPPEQLALFAVPVGVPADLPPPLPPRPRKVTASAERSPQQARDEYRRRLHGGGFNGNPVALVGRLTTLAVEAGRTPDQLLADLTNPRNTAGHAAFTERSSGGQRVVREATVRGWYERDARRAAPTWNTADTLQRLAELREHATAMPWPQRVEYVTVRTAWLRDDAGRYVRHGEGKRKGKRIAAERYSSRERVSGDTCRKVYLAHLALAMESGSCTNAASVRCIADRAQVSRPTVERAHRALRHLQLLRPATSSRRGSAFTACRFRVELSPSYIRGHSRDNGSTLPIGLSPVVPQMTATGHATDTASHPAFRHGSGLRHDVWSRVLSDDGQATTTTLADELGRNARTVRRQVEALARVGLVERMDDGTLRAHVVDLDAIAERNGMAKRQHAQAQRHHDDRSQYRRELAIDAAREAGMRVRTEAVTGRDIGIDRHGEVVDLHEWFTKRQRRTAVSAQSAAGHEHPPPPPPPDTSPPRTLRAAQPLEVVA